MLAAQDKLFPPLMSALDDDYETGTRALACKLFGHMVPRIDIFLNRIQWT
eukprot:COSAG05_NODE_1123_length_5793_cov_4.158588_10_plen_50_part_00